MIKAVILTFLFGLPSAVGMGAEARQPDPILSSWKEPNTYHWNDCSPFLRSNILESLYGHVVQMTTNIAVQIEYPLWGGNYAPQVTDLSLFKYETASEFTFNLGTNTITYIRGKVSQSIGGDSYLVAISTDDEDKTVMITIPGNASVMDGDTIQGFCVSLGPYDYTTMLGSPHRVASYAMSEVRNAAPDEIYDAIQAGETFVAWAVVTSSCVKCKQSGKVLKSPGRLEKCPVCNGTRITKGVRCINITK